MKGTDTSRSSGGKRRHESSAASLVALENARNEALRESFRLGGAMNDLQRAADDVQGALADLDHAVWKTSPKV